MSVEIPAKQRELCLDLMAGGMSRAEIFSDEKTLVFLEAALDAVEKGSRAGGSPWESAVKLADSLGNDDMKIQLLLDVLLWARARSAQEASKADRGSDAAHALCRNALEAVFLRKRLSSYANKKLVALAAASLAYPGAPGESG